MPDVIALEVATPERQLVREGAAEVQVPGENGYLGILPGHAPLLSKLGTGLLSYLAGGKRRYLAIDGGFLEVLPGQVRVLAYAAERAEDIDLEGATADLKRAQERLATPGADPSEALGAIRRAEARIAAAGHR